ncbi:MAG TPA: alpha/beta hydrolase [Vicinamibacterales bacterium]|nr:alpha/beta hydrolase [Vicinamibacterales bacterium]
MMRSLLISCVFAGVASAQTLPAAPGALVDIGNGRRLHLLCSGQGAPTIILEAGASSFAIDWTLVQRELAKSNRVCSYDRAGMGWSDPLPTDALATEAADLRSLLAAAKVPGPYVLVGASRGGLLIRDYLARYPADVIGLVFIDPGTEDRLWSMVGGRAFLIAEMTSDQIRSSLPPKPVPVPRRPVQKGAPFDKLPPELYEQRLLLDERLIAAQPETVTPEQIFLFQDHERQRFASLLASRKAGTPFGDRPTIVLSRGTDRDGGREASHAAVAKLSTRSRHRVIEGAGHEIHLFEPPAVVSAIREVIELYIAK